MFDVWIGCALMVDTGGPVRKQHTPVLGLDSSSRPFIFLCRKMKDYFFLQGNLNAQSESFMSRQVRAWRCSQRTSLIYSLSHNSKWVIATMYWDNGSNQQQDDIWKVESMISIISHETTNSRETCYYYYHRYIIIMSIIIIISINYNFIFRWLWTTRIDVRPETTPPLFLFVDRWKTINCL